MTLVPTFSLSPDGTLTEEEGSPLLTTPEPQVADCETASSEVLSSLSPVCSSVPETTRLPHGLDTAHSHLLEPKVLWVVLQASKIFHRDPQQKNERGQPSSDSSGISSCVESFQSYITKKQSIFVEA